LQDDFDLKMAKGSGDAFIEINEQYKKDALDYGGLAGTKAKLDAYYGRQRIIKEQERASEVLNLQKTFFDTMAGLTPVLEDQLFLKRKSLVLENELAQAAITKMMAEKPYLAHLEDELRLQQAVMAQAKKFNLEMENDKGLQGWAYGRVKSDSQKNTWADAMGGLEDFVGNAWTQGIQGALSKTKVDWMEIAKTMAQSFILNMGKQGITWGFGQLAKGILGDKAAGQLGTESNPMVVTIKGMGLSGLGKGSEASFGRSVAAAGKTGMTLGGGKGLGASKGFSFTDQYKQMSVFDKAFDKNLKDWNKEWKTLDKTGDASWKGFGTGLKTYSKGMDEIIDQNQEAFTTEYITSYQDSFAGMATGITGIWGTAQGIMTAAGVSGEAQRYGAMVTYGIQGISLIAKLAQSKVLIDAARAAAAGYSSAMEALPWPINVPIAIAWAALSFAGTMAAGAISSSAGGDYQVAATGPRYVHQDETILPAWAANSWRNIVSREESGSMPGENEGGGLSIGAIHIDARGASKDIDWDHVLKRKIIPGIDKALGKRGLQKIGGGR
jgi:hypothetical protein